MFGRNEAHLHMIANEPLDRRQSRRDSKAGTNALTDYYLTLFSYFVDRFPLCLDRPE